MTRGERSKADELDRGFWNKMDRGAKAGCSDVSGMDGCSISAGNRDGSGERGGLEKIGEGIGDGERGAGIEHEGCDDRSVGGSSSWVL